MQRQWVNSSATRAMFPKESEKALDHRCTNDVLDKLDGSYPKTIYTKDITNILLKLTCHHINRRHFCFNIKSISVHPLLWMNVMLDFIFMVFAGM